MERDLHDGVQNELVALVVKLALAQEDAGIPPAVAKTLAGLEARARAGLDAVRDIVRGIYPPQLAEFGLVRALRAPAARSPRREPRTGRAARIEEARTAFYFVCSEAIQDVATHAGRAAQINSACITAMERWPCASQTTVEGLTRHRPPTARG